MSEISKITPEHGKHDFDGSWNPTNGFRGHNTTFSVAVFQWHKGVSGKLKKLPCVIRVKGDCAEAEKVYAKARDLCQRLDMGIKLSAKSVTV